MLFKDFVYFSSGGHFVQQCRTICTFMIEGYFGEHLYDIILNLDQWFRRRYCPKKSILALVAKLLGGAKLFLQFR